MKKHRRYRENLTGFTLSFASTHANHRIHDFLKGWGTVAKDGKSILWDWWRPQTKKQRDKLERHWKKHPPFSKWIFPVIKNMPDFSDVDLRAIISAQPME
jgi:hypothetical protein